jgi:hypothetical protein
MLQEALRLDSFIRDTLQLYIGEDPQAESRRSLQQATSVGRVTFLAFIFLPLSLVTLFFGMNIRELNGNGPQMRLFLISAGSLTASMFVCWFFWVFAGMFRKGYLRWKEWNYVFSTRDDCRPGSSLPEWKIIKSLEEKGEHTKHCVWYLTSRGRDERFYTPGVEKVIASSWRRVPYIWTLVMWYFIIHSLLGVLKFCRNPSNISV